LFLIWSRSVVSRLDVVEGNAETLNTEIQPGLSSDTALSPLDGIRASMRSLKDAFSSPPEIPMTGGTTTDAFSGDETMGETIEDEMIETDNAMPQ